LAKYTLAHNAGHDDVLLAMLKAVKVLNQPAAAVAVLKEVVDAAESVDTARLHKEALAAIEDLKQKGPAYKRNASWWASSARARSPAAVSPPWPARSSSALPA
jgi:hypothetical protein